MVKSGDPTRADTAIRVMATAIDAMLWLIDRNASVRKTSRNARCRRRSLRVRNCSSMVPLEPASFTDCTPPKSSPTNPVTASVALRISRRRRRISGTSAWVRPNVNTNGTRSTSVSPASIDAMTPNDPRPKTTKPPPST